MNLEQIQSAIEHELEEMKAKDINSFDVTKVTTMTDIMVICTGTSNRHVKAIADNLVAKMKEKGIAPVGVEGAETAEWILVDLNHALVHVMLSETRDFYQLDKLWDPRFAEESKA